MSNNTRLRKLRELTGLPRTSFCRKHDLSSSSLSAWESGASKFTPQTAEKLIQCFKAEGLSVTTDWLLKGVGDPPFKQQVSASQAPTDSNEEEEAIWREAIAFKNLYANALVYKISDDSCLPTYLPGDYVGGVCIPQQKLDLILGQRSLILLQNKLTMLRIIKPGSSPGEYNLHSLNSSPMMVKPLLENVKIEAAAPIIWFRRKSIVS